MNDSTEFPQNPEVQFKEPNLAIEDKTQEIVLDDHFAQSSAESNLSLPAALCDDKLLVEMNSIPNKMGFKIGEVADMLSIKQYVLRYWETEFDVLKPKKASNNQRYYTKKDVENAFLIRKLLHRDRFSIEGARAALRELKNFAKGEIKKEREWSQINVKLEGVQDQIDDLLSHITRLKVKFLD